MISQRVRSNKKTIETNFQGRKNYKAYPTKPVYSTATKSPSSENDDDIIVTKPKACLDSNKDLNCEHLADEKGHIIYPVVKIEKRQVDIDELVGVWWGGVVW